jgi:hypothetical protein
MTSLIALSGRKGSGKDTAFGYIERWAGERGVRAVRRGFADRMKWSFARMFIPDCSMFEGVQFCDRLKEFGTLEAAQVSGELKMIWQLTGRKALQRYGTEGHRDLFHDNFWVDALLPLTFDENGSFDEQWKGNFRDGLAHPDYPEPEICVITDCRFENEAERVRELNGYIWGIERHNFEDDGHASEAALPDHLVDLKIPNFSGFDEFEQKIRDAMDNNFGETYELQRKNSG